MIDYAMYTVFDFLVEGLYSIYCTRNATGKVSGVLKMTTSNSYYIFQFTFQGDKPSSGESDEVNEI